MMVLDLKCSQEHYFEGWFANSENFSRQRELGEIRCPVCEDNQISQALSPVAIKRGSRVVHEGEDSAGPFKKLEQFYKYIEENFEEVGTEFTKEALKMHYGVSDKRNIRGISTDEEEKTLKDEGVEFYKIPKIPLPRETINPHEPALVQGNCHRRPDYPGPRPAEALVWHLPAQNNK